MLGGMLKDLVARHDPSVHFIQNDVPTKLDKRAACVPRNDPYVGLEEAKYRLS